MALSCSWGGYADTDVDFTEFFRADHTIAVRFMLQYPNAYTGPMLSLNGTGTYLVGPGDFLADPTRQAKLVMNIGTEQVSYAVNLPAGTWHHLAVVRSGTVFQMYLDGQPVGTPLNAPASNLPAGRLRFGKNTFDATLDGGGAQFYGLLDDVALFQQALSASRVAELANALHLTGYEQDLYAGYVFGAIPDTALPPTLARPLVLTPAANIVQVSPDRDNTADASLLPLSLTSLAHLPFPPGLALLVIQGYDNPTGSHQGYASFCLDLILAGQPQSASNGQPFYAAAPGTVDFVKQDASSGGAINFISIKQAQLEFCDYLHLSQNSAQVQVGDAVTFQQYLANIGDTGAPVGSYHLHIAVTNLGEGHKYAGGSFVTIPSPYVNYDASDDNGNTWHHVLRGVPQPGQWIRRPLEVGPVRYTAVWEPSTEGEIQVYGWTYQDYRAKYDELWPQGWRLKLLDVSSLKDQGHTRLPWRRA